MRWFEREFADYERLMKEQTGVSSLNQLNEIAEKTPPGCDGLVFLPYWQESVPLYGIHMQKACFTDWIFLRQRGIWYVPAWKAWLFLSAIIWKRQKKPERRQKY